MVPSLNRNIRRPFWLSRGMGAAQWKKVALLRAAETIEAQPIFGQIKP
jgi:hypothetical protein